MDPERVEAFFGDKHKCPGIDHLKRIARVGVPVDVLPGGDLTKELEYGNHSSASTFDEAVWEKAVADVAWGRAIVFPKEQAGQVPGLRVSPIGVVEEREKIRIIHDMTFEHRDGEEGGSVNATTDWDEIPACALAGVMHEVLQRVLGLRVKFGDRARILIQKMDVKNAFRQIPVDPDGAAAFGYVLGRYLFVDLRLQFGWRGSPGWWGVISAAMQHAQCNTTRASASFSQAGDRAVEHVTIAPSTGRPVVGWPAECVVRPAKGGGANDTAFVVFFMDDAISIEVQWEKGGGRCLDLSRSLASIHFEAMGERCEGEEPLLSQKKVTGWATQQEVLGYDIDTESMTIALPPRKVDDLRAQVAKWPVGRETATVKEVLVLAGKLHHASFVIRPGRYFVRRLLQLSNLHLNGAERAGGGGRGVGTGSRPKRDEFYGCRGNSWQTWGGGDGFWREERDTGERA